MGPTGDGEIQMNVDIRVLQSLASPLLEQGDPIFVSIGCGRVYVAPIPPTKCKRCDDVHDVYSIQSMEDIDLIPRHYTLTIPT